MEDLKDLMKGLAFVVGGYVAFKVIMLIMVG